ncbi:MAG: hypothetical protein IPL12_07620 [Bacteroidetes bacterium]|nr:hypothetical protein [Bacteroidota bacterium]
MNATNRQLSVIDSLIKVGDFSEAQKLSLQMLKTAAETGDCANEVMANFKNAEIVALLKDDFQAIQFCQDGIAKAKNCDADSAYWLCIRYLGGLYFGHNPDSATYYLKLAYELKKNSNWHRLISSTCGMLANNYTENFRDTAQSLIWYERSMKHALMSPDSAALGYAYLRYAAFLGNAGNCIEAIPMMQESYAIFKRMNDTEGMMFSLKSLAQTYNTCGVKDSVFFVMYRILDLQDTIYKNETARKTAEYRTIYETEKGKRKCNKGCTNSTTKRTTKSDYNRIYCCVCFGYFNICNNLLSQPIKIKNRKSTQVGRSTIVAIKKCGRSRRKGKNTNCQGITRWCRAFN